MSKIINTVDFIKKAKLVHGDKYDYSKSEYIGYYEKITIICNIHGVFEQSVRSHLDGTDCIRCANTRISKEYIEYILYFKHLTPLDNYINVKDSIQCQCQICHYIWKTSLATLVNEENSGCPECYKIRKLRCCNKCNAVLISNFNWDIRLMKKHNHTCKKQERDDYRNKNKEKINSKRRVENLPEEEINNKRSKNKQYRDKNNNAMNARRRKRKKERWLTDPSYKIRENFSNLFRYSLQSKTVKKDNSCFEIVGYSPKELKQHLESLFEPWMTWDNHGKYNAKTWKDEDSSTWTWQIDHIIPIASFTFSNDNYDEIRKCWALSNLRPYSAKQNNIDGGSKIRHINKHKRKIINE